MDDQGANRKGSYRMSRGFKIFLAALIGGAVWLTIVDTLAMYLATRK
jgi:hypothetical protein